MDEFNNLINSNEVDNKYHKKIFEDDLFEKFLSKINLEEFKELKNQIYWISLIIFRCSTINYIESVNKSIQKNNEALKLSKKNIVVFHPFGNITSEMCKLFYNNYVYSSLVSTLCRQLIEQVCLIKEIEQKKIDEIKIIEASIESYNMHLGCNSIQSTNLNTKNAGLLKIFDNKVSFGSLARKYKYGFMYNFFSGDIHTQSQIEKLIPLNNIKNYNEIYLRCVLTLLRDCLLIVKKYDENKLNIDLTKLTNIDFIEIKSTKKGKI